MPAGQPVKPGAPVAEAGIYRCNAEGGECPHYVHVKGRRFPPLPRTCHGDAWLLETSVRR
ncbi:MAG: hypothetical protein J2P40_04555 [Candidatus Dormibacteraeota bacterium]|nr:hypothetical protein [Candidatus Dormibacteraeota bacterium]MBO0703857.1 hypothetical protein [Candidatus Dormibacteraeota bacterium]MBO0760528.1 hypothetical protein [Candidatus Dormibacteraeota bacterium]